MKVHILANDRASFIKPMAEGLSRMLAGLGATPVVHLDGLSRLMLRQRLDTSSLRSLGGSLLRLREAHVKLDELTDQLRDADVLVVVANVPMSFSPSLLPNIEVLRQRLPELPIVNYDLHYLPTMDSWARFLLRGEKTKFGREYLAVFDRGKFGLERYDWYLMASVATELSLPPGPHPYSMIGLDLDDGSLFPDQRGRFRVVVDFPQSRGDFPSFRAIQLEALDRAGVDVTVLNRPYSIEEVRSVYRQSSIFLMASAEAFGLPICELQACGSLIFLPDPLWASAHWLGNDFYAVREPVLSSNFVIYDNIAESLAARIAVAASEMNPAAVRATLEQVQPQFLRGDREALAKFLDKVQSGAIHSRLHSEHSAIGNH
ncbi:MAG: hypothetical protein ABIS03_05975 [Gemmatimonadaceae bacterium]